MPSTGAPYPAAATDATNDANESASIDDLLTQCTEACRTRDLETCLRTARLILRLDPSCRRAFAFKCRSLFELRRYREAESEARHVLRYGDLAPKGRERMGFLEGSCRLLLRLQQRTSDGTTGTSSSEVVLSDGTAAGDRLRDGDGWYRKRLRHLSATGSLIKYAKEGHLIHGVGRDELSLVDCSATQGLPDVVLANGGERRVPEGLLEANHGGGGGEEEGEEDAVPVEQALGGVVYRKGAILPFHCDDRFWPSTDDHWSRRSPNKCYTGHGPCRRCQIQQFPVPTHRFPTWHPTLPTGTTVTVPNPNMDVLYSTDAVPTRLRRQLASGLDRLAKTRRHYPMPKYHNLIDPNVNAHEGLWLPAEFDVTEAPYVETDAVTTIDLACLAATGRRLPPGFAHDIARLAAEAGAVRATCALQTPIDPELDPHDSVLLHLAAQRVMTAALPLLARLRRPSLLLPGPLQAVVKAQRIVLADGTDYQGVWHEDGMDEHVVAVVLYYYRAASTLLGGALEFCSKERQALWSGDAGGDLATAENTAYLASSLPRCQVPVQEGTLVCFSNYAAVHRVLPLEAPEGSGGGGSREFLAFFVVDQRHPLPTPSPASLAPRETRVEAAQDLLARQLAPRGKFGFDSCAVYSTGNGSVADVGWATDGVDGSGRHCRGVAEAYPESASLIHRLNLPPPTVGRGLSEFAQGPPPPPGEVVEHNPLSPWAEVWVDEGAEASVFYLETDWHEGIRAGPPQEGVSEVRRFPGGMAEFAAFVEEEGYWTEDPFIQARLDERTIEIIVAGRQYHVMHQQLEPIAKLRGLQEGARCELERFLHAFDLSWFDDAAAHQTTNEDDGEFSVDEDGEFVTDAWSETYKYILHPHYELEPLSTYRGHSDYYKASQTDTIVRQLFNLKSTAVALGFRALWKAADDAIKEVRRR